MRQEEKAETAKLKEKAKEEAEERPAAKTNGGKSSLIIDVKPWDDETDLKEMEELVRSIEMAGLVWGDSKFVKVAFGIEKLQIMLTIEDEKVPFALLWPSLTDIRRCMTIAWPGHHRARQVTTANRST